MDRDDLQRLVNHRSSEIADALLDDPEAIAKLMESADAIYDALAEAGIGGLNAAGAVNTIVTGHMMRRVLEPPVSPRED